MIKPSIHASLCVTMLLLSPICAFAAKASLATYKEKAPHVYLAYDEPDVLPQSQVTTLMIELGLDVRIDDRPLGFNPPAIFDKKTTWAFVDLKPGVHVISAKPWGAPDEYRPEPGLVKDVIGLFDSKETRAAKRAPVPNVFKRTIVGMPGQIHALTYFSHTSRSYKKTSISYLVRIDENKDAELAGIIDTYRQQYRNQFATMTPMSLSHNEADWGKKRVSIPITNSALQADLVIKCVENVLAHRAWKKEHAGEGVFIASKLVKPLHRGGFYAKYANSTLNIYGDELDEDWIKEIKKKLTSELKHVNPDDLIRFSLDCPQDRWGEKLADAPLPAGTSLEKAKAAVLRGFDAYQWKTENMNDSLIIGSYQRGNTKHALYVKYDSNLIEIYGDKKIEKWGKNVRKGAVNFINAHR
ncbi:hypothetical protein M2103_000411 [Ereboglobus sp. PH5-5]|uniref:hypothetical protein n=1 Tax=Ereboglobus sp. PH5-5 TaxID=2940529 RepID=UPI002405B897|nr:hypothetical protein [Ereboglobus sp. PH5-5]MDF9832203.1 hypothetical protein [Ereboglobus sp. PH5-5]